MPVSAKKSVLPSVAVPGGFILSAASAIRLRISESEMFSFLILSTISLNSLTLIAPV